MAWLRVAAIVLAALSSANVASAQPPHCPPGHAKKGWCTPGEPAWRLGKPPPEGAYVVIEFPRQRGLPPAPKGRVYVEIDDDILLLATATGLIVDVVGRQ